MGEQTGKATKGGILGMGAEMKYHFLFVVAEPKSGMWIWKSHERYSIETAMESSIPRHLCLTFPIAGSGRME